MDMVLVLRANVEAKVEKVDRAVVPLPSCSRFAMKSYIQDTSDSDANLLGS